LKKDYEAVFGSGDKKEESTDASTSTASSTEKEANTVKEEAPSTSTSESRGDSSSTAKGKEDSSSSDSGATSDGKEEAKVKTSVFETLSKTASNLKSTVSDTISKAGVNEDTLKRARETLQEQTKKVTDSANEQLKEQLEKNEALKQAREAAEKVVKDGGKAAEGLNKELQKQSWYAGVIDTIKSIEFRKNFDEAWAGLVNDEPAKAPVGMWTEREKGDGSIEYYHTGTGAVQREKPKGYVSPKTTKKEGEGEEEGEEQWRGTSALVAVKAGQSFYERIGEQLKRAPIIEDIIKGFDQVKKSEAGQKAKKVRDTLNDAAGDLRETWETSQNPWIYRMSSAYDTVFGDTEEAAAIREARKYDPTFDPHQFGSDMEKITVPYVLSAFMQGNNNALRHICSEGAYAQIYAAIKHRKQEGLVVNPKILDVSDLELRASKIMDKGSPIFVYICKAQQFTSVRDRSGNLVEGSDDEIVACYYAFAMQQQLNDETQAMDWKVVEMQVVGMEHIW
jgi:import inner membrane translocase subunit TIM44